MTKWRIQMAQNDSLIIREFFKEHLLEYLDDEGHMIPEFEKVWCAVMKNHLFIEEAGKEMIENDESLPHLQLFAF